MYMQLHRHRIIEKLEKENINMETVQIIRKMKLGLADSLSRRRVSLSPLGRGRLSFSLALGRLWTGPVMDIQNI